MTSALSGIRVVCAAVYVPAPLAAQRLETLGASVIRVEPPAGDPLALMAPGLYHALLGDQQALRLDLKTARDAETFEELLADSDVLITATRPASLARLGLDWPQLHARHPRLCHVAIVGDAGENSELPGHDLTYQARAGLLKPEQWPHLLVADYSGGDQAASAALALLLARERGRGAAFAEVALGEEVKRYAGPLQHGLTATNGILGGARPEYGVYRAKEGWVAVAALEPHFKERLFDELSLASEAGRDEVAAALLRRSAAEWETWGIERGLPLAALRVHEDRWLSPAKTLVG
jgi:crotonobetainyl-CoA:carnitine CoA-transferase CaiB-like acyl-CoA transferase